MASYGLKILVNPKIEDKESTDGAEKAENFVDVIAVCGRKCTCTGLPQVDSTNCFDGIDDGLSSVFDLCSPKARCSIFSYELEDLFLRQGIRDVALRLLETILEVGEFRGKVLYKSFSALRLCADDMIKKNRSIVFACRDVGGIVVKEALTIAIFGDPQYREISDFTSCIIFLGYPHRCLSIRHLAETYQRLFKVEGPDAFELSPVLANSLAASTVSVNQSFLDTKLLFRIILVNVYSQNEDLRESIFDPYKTTMLIHENKSSTKQFQWADARPHRNISLQGLPVSDWHIPHLRTAIFEGITIPSVLPLLLPQVNSQMVDTGLAMRQDIQNSRSAIINSAVFQGWEKKTIPGYLMIYDACDALAIGTSVYSHLLVESSQDEMIQFYEFRSWDDRYDSVESMLSTFLAEISQFGVGSWGKHLQTLQKESLKSKTWTVQQLLLTYYECILDGGHYEITWVLVNLEESIHSYRELLSNLSRFLTGSDLKFDLVIVNQYPAELGPYESCFNILSSNGCDKSLHWNETNMTLSPVLNIQISTDSRIEEHKEEQSISASNTNGNSTFDQDLWECIIHAPSLFKEKNQLQKIFVECKRDLDLWQMMVTWIKTRATSLPLIDLPRQINSLVPVTTEKIFSFLCLPLSDSESHMAAALELLFHSFRALTNSELEHLEKATGYGVKIGSLLESHPNDFYQCKTLDLLAGVAHIQGDEIQFCHAQFRDFIIAQAKTGQERFEFATENGARLAHTQITIWCLEVMVKATSSDWLRCQANDEKLTLLESRQDFLPYAIMHWVRHVKAAGEKAMNLGLVHKFLQDQTTVDLWVKAYWSHSNQATRGSVESISPLAIFAENGAEQLLAMAIDEQQQLPAFQKQCYHALSAAVRRGHSQVVHALKSHQTFECKLLDDLLIGCFASRDLNSEITHEFLQLAKERPELLEDASAVLNWAAFYGLEDAIRVLIPLVSERQKIEVSKIHIQSFLRGACVQTGHDPDIIKTLVEASSEQISPQHLQMACKLGVAEVIPFLCSMMPSGGNDEKEGKLPTWFHEVLNISVKNGHGRVLKELLQFDPLKKKWPTADSLKYLTSAISNGKFKCFSEFASHLGIEIMKEMINDLLEAAIQAHAAPLVRYLLGLSMGSELEVIPLLLSYAAREDGQVSEILEILVQEGLKACEHTSSADELITMVNPVIRSGNMKLVSQLLEKSPPLDSPTWYKRHPLFYAAMRGKKGIVKALLEAKADPNVVGDNDGWRPIHAAYDNPDILELLLDAGASTHVNATDNAGKTALFYACRWGYYDSVKVLLKFGAKSCCYIDRETELSIAVLSGKSEIVLLLLEKGVNPLEYSAASLKTPLLHHCVRQNLVQLLKSLLSFNFDVNERDENGSVALHYIDSVTTKSTLEILIRWGANTNIVDYTGITPLLAAIQSQNNEAVEYLLSKGADVNMPTGEYGTALNMACYSGKLESATNLVENNANVNFSYPGLYGTPLHSAILRPDDDEKYRIIEYLLSRKDLDLHQSVPWWGGYLGLACLCGSLSLLNTLTAKDSTKVNEGDKIGRRPIHFALYRTLDHVKHLLKTGAEIEVTDRMKRNALHFAVVSGRLDIVRFVLANNMDLANSRDIDNWTPLMWAVRICGKWDTRSNCRLDIIKELLGHGADRMAEGEGLGRTWTAYELAWYYNLDNEIVDMVTPTSGELQKVRDKEHGALWAYRMKSRKIRGRDGPSDSYCDACLMMLNGIIHNCEICGKFRLCFKCYRSRNMIHAGHAFYVWREDEEYEGYVDTDLSSYTSDSEESSNE